MHFQYKAPTNVASHFKQLSIFFRKVPHSARTIIFLLVSVQNRSHKLWTSSHLVYEMLYLSSKEKPLQTDKQRNKSSVPLVTFEQKLTSL